MYKSMSPPPPPNSGWCQRYTRRRGSLLRRRARRDAECGCSAECNIGDWDRGWGTFLKRGFYLDAPTFVILPSRFHTCLSKHRIFSWCMHVFSDDLRRYVAHAFRLPSLILNVFSNKLPVVINHTFKRTSNSVGYFKSRGTE